MAAFTGFRTPVKLGTDALPLAQRRRSPDWMIWTALAVFLATGPALPQAGVSLVKVDLSVVAQGYRLSKVIGSSVINDKNEKIGTIDDLIADKDKKQLNFAVLQVGGFLGQQAVGDPADPGPAGQGVHRGGHPTGRDDLA